MGGFAGGDEAGFWDEDPIYTVVQKQKNKKSSELDFDTTDCTIKFIACECGKFSIEGYDDVALEASTIYKTYKALCDFTNDEDIELFFLKHTVAVLEESDENSIHFLYLLRDECALLLSNSELLQIKNSVEG